MVIVSLNGRLGNQLFQYAFAYASFKKFNTPYLIDDSVYKDSFLKYFEAISIYDNKYIRKIVRKLSLLTVQKKVNQTGFEPVEDILEQISNNCHYDGFFQSIIFFNNVSKNIKHKFKIRQEYQVAFIEKYGSLFQDKKVLAIHYRLGDYLSWNVELLGGEDLSLPEEYYLQALKQVKDLDSYTVIIVTDDKENIKGKLTTLKNKIVISDSEISDFQMLLHADKLIISNSTFAWWAAFLNVKDAEVFAPEYWIGFKVKKEYPIGIIPNHFTKVSFNKILPGCSTCN